jgi:YidC/Oxa1 family membrane protein insertase
MFLAFFHNVLYVPIYNLLVFLIDVVPGGDVGLAVILATIIVKVVIMPLSLSAARTQRRMKGIESKLKEIKEKHKDSREDQAKQMMALYKEHGIRPFASLFAVIVQIPIVIALYLVTQKALALIDPSLLYSFVSAPAQVSPLLFDRFPVAGHSLILALLAAVAQYVAAHVSIPVPKKAAEGKKTSASEDFGRMMAIQARFMLPVIIGIAAYTTSGAIALYFITASLVGIVQEFIVRRLHPEPKVVAA